MTTILVIASITMLVLVSALHVRTMTMVGGLLVLLFGGLWSATLIPDPLIPLRIPQITFAIAVGLLLGYTYRNVKLIDGLPYPIISMLAFFVIASFPLGNLPTLSFVTYHLLHVLPIHIAAVVLATSLARITKPLDIFIVFPLCGMVIGAISIIEVHEIDISFYNWLHEVTNIPGKAADLQLPGFLRPVGVDGDPISTGQRAAIFIPLILFSMMRCGSIYPRMIYHLGMVFASIGVMLSQSRAVILGLLLGGGYLYITSKRLRSIIIWYLIILPVGICISSNGRALIYSIVNRFDFRHFTLSEYGGVMDPQRVVGAKSALELLIGHPFLGSGDYIYVFEKLLDGNDVNPFLLYLASGGIPLFICFIVFLGGMLLSIHKQSLVCADAIDGYMLNSVFSAIFVGIFPLLINNTPKIIPSLVLIFSFFYFYFSFGQDVRLNLYKQGVK